MRAFPRITVSGPVDLIKLLAVAILIGLLASLLLPSPAKAVNGKASISR